MDSCYGKTGSWAVFFREILALNYGYYIISLQIISPLLITVLKWANGQLKPIYINGSQEGYSQFQSRASRHLYPLSEMYWGWLVRLQNRVSMIDRACTCRTLATKFVAHFTPRKGHFYFTKISALLLCKIIIIINSKIL